VVFSELGYFTTTMTIKNSENLLALIKIQVMNGGIFLFSQYGKVTIM